MKDLKSRFVPKGLNEFIDKIQALAHRSGEETYDEVNNRLLECLAMIGVILCYGMKILISNTFILIVLACVSFFL